ncbi:hypothetical protein VTH06DRAFT_6033 [Thermothelomyces fergusii]
MNRPPFPSRMEPQTVASSSLSPDDYYAILGSCCPKAFTPWTAALGGVTPCYSALPASATLPPATSEEPGPGTAIPTVTVTDTLFAMQYAVSRDRANLSLRGVAGAIAGGVVFSSMLLWVYMALRERHLRHKMREELRAEYCDTQGPIPGSSEVPVSPAAASHPFNRITRTETK